MAVDLKNPALRAQFADDIEKLEANRIPVLR
jgi:hypothetical protein